MDKELSEMTVEELWRKYEHDRDAYSEAKGEFIRKWTDEALKKYKNRY